MNAQEAKRLLADENLKEAFSLMRERYRKEFENTTPDDVEGLQRVRLKFDLIRDLFGELNRVINDEIMKQEM